MNNADFLSDAVALDLGKSGVKVAETLEIQVGEEWWRLINAADVTDVTKFNYRAAADPVVVGGKLLLSDFSVRSLPLLHQSKQADKTPPVDAQPPMGVFCSLDGETANIIGTVTYPYTTTYQIHSAVRLNNTFNHRAILRGSTYTSDIVSPTIELCSFWDAVNARFVNAYQTTNATGNMYTGIVFSPADGAVTYNISAASAALYRKLLDVQCFSHAPDTVYKVYRDASGNLWVDTFSLFLDEAITTVKSNLESISANAVQITVATTNNVGPAGLFYSRWHGSVGIMWRSSTTGICSYVLESESWGVEHALPSFLTSQHTIKYRSIGTLSIPNSGEFLVVGTERTDRGAIGTSVGYTYPANLKILGNGYLGENTSAVIGCVGNTLYRYVIDLSTMAITQETSGDAGAALGNLSTIAIDKVEAKLIYRDSSCEYWVIFGYDTYGIGYFQFGTGRWLVCFTAAGVYKWCLDVGGTTSVFPATVSAMGTTLIRTSVGYPATDFYSSRIQRLGEEHVFFSQGYHNGSTYKLLSYFSMSFTTLNAASDAAAVLASLPTFKSVSGNSSSTDRIQFNVACDPPDLVIMDDNYYYMISLQSSSATTRTVIVVDRISHDIVTYRNGAISYNSGDTFVGKWVAPGYFCHHLVDDGDLFAVSNGRADQGMMSLAAFKSTMGSGTIREVVDSSVALARRYMTDAELYASIPPRYFVGMPTTNANTKIWAIAGNRNVIGFLGVDTTTYSNPGVFSNLYSLDFVPRQLIVNPETDELWALSDVADNEISYDRFVSAGREQEHFVIDVAGNVYEIDYGEVPGGIQEIRSTGNILTAVSGGGTNYLYETGASATEGVGTLPVENSAAIVYNYVSQNFIPYPFAREGIRAELSNISKTTKITLPETQDNLIRGMLAAGTDFRGSRCILRRVFPDHLDEAGADIVLLDGYIQDWSYVPGKQGIAFSVSKTLIDVGAQFPKRLMNMGCSHVFKGSRCRYLGEEGRCLKTRAFCTSLGNLNQFGGFPWVAARQRRVMWK
jgi:phage-related protein